MTDSTNEAAIGVPSIKVQGAVISPELALDLSYLRVARSVGMTSHAEVRFRKGLEHGSAFSIGDDLEVGSVDDGGTTRPLFKGKITNLSIDMSHLATTLSIEALDETRRLNNKVSLSSELNVSANDIISEIARGEGLTAAIDPVLSVTFDSFQVYGTSLQFLDMLAARYGCEWSVDDGTLSVKRRASSGTVILSAGQELQQFNARIATSGLPTEVKVRGWDPERKEPILGTAQVTSSHSLRPSTRIARDAGKLPDERGQVVEVIRAGVPSQAEADKVAKGIADRIAAMHVSGSGETLVNADLKPTATVTIAGMGTDWNGDYHVTAVEHVFGTDRSFTTRFTVGSYEPGGLSGVLGASAGVTSQHQITTGISVGIVTDNADEAGQGRVKVNIPNISDRHETFWARLVSPGAGAERGLLMLPEVGDEVAVAFENGDIERPYVLGGLWGGVDGLPTHDEILASGTVVSRSITTREGTHIALIDADGNNGDPYVRVETANGVVVLHLGEDLVELVTNDVDVTIDNTKSKLEMLKGGAVSIISTAGDISISAGSQGNVTIEGNNIDLKAASNVTAEGKMNATLKAGMGATVQGGTTADIKATMVNLN